MKKNQVLVLGGSGFLGSHVADALSAARHEVRIFDNRPSPYLRSEQEMIVGDLMNSDQVAAAAKGCRYVYNFAGLADIDDARRRPLDTANLNVIGNMHALQAAHEAGAERFLFASSVYVYSHVGSFYGASKQAAERFVESFQISCGLDYTILRYGSLYGPRSDSRNGLYRIVRGALERGTIRYEGSPEAIREYIHVEDAARASVKALDEGFRNRHVVLTGQEGMRVVDLLKMLAEILGRPDAVEFVETSHDGHYVRTPYAYRPNVGQKYVPSLHVDLGQGLIQLIEDVQRELEKTGDKA
ncbi:MAG: NAD-dependent epimerase/dehydratase family protein [Steroidobacteraceae bacterium]